MIGERIKELRIENGYSQKELAQILKVSNKTISHWESNYTQPPIQAIIAMKKLFNVGYDELLD